MLPRPSLILTQNDFDSMSGNASLVPPSLDNLRTKIITLSALIPHEQQLLDQRAHTLKRAQILLDEIEKDLIKPPFISIDYEQEHSEALLPNSLERSGFSSFISVRFRNPEWIKKFVSYLSTIPSQTTEQGDLSEDLAHSQSKDVTDSVLIAENSLASEDDSKVELMNRFLKEASALITVETNVTLALNMIDDLIYKIDLIKGHMDTLSRDENESVNEPELVSKFIEAMQGLEGLLEVTPAFLFPIISKSRSELARAKVKLNSKYVDLLADPQGLAKEEIINALVLIARSGDQVILAQEHARIRSKTLLDEIIAGEEIEEEAVVRSLLNQSSLYREGCSRELALTHFIFPEQATQIKIMVQLTTLSQEYIKDRLTKVCDLIKSMFRRGELTLVIRLAACFEPIKNNLSELQESPSFSTQLSCFNPALNSLKELLRLFPDQLINYIKHPRTPPLANASLWPHTAQVMEYLRILSDEMSLVNWCVDQPESLISGLLRCLLEIIDGHSRTIFKTSASQAMFRLNNINFCLTRIQSLIKDNQDNTLQAQFSTILSTIQTSIGKDILSLMAGWRAMSNVLSSDPQQAPRTHALPSRDKLRAFLQAFDELLSEHQSLLVTDNQLRESLRKQVIDIVLPSFSAFYSINQQVLFVNATMGTQQQQQQSRCSLDPEQLTRLFEEKLYTNTASIKKQ